MPVAKLIKNSKNIFFHSTAINKFYELSKFVVTICAWVSITVCLNAGNWEEKLLVIINVMAIKFKIKIFDFFLGIFGIF